MLSISETISRSSKNIHWNKNFFPGLNILALINRFRGLYDRIACIDPQRRPCHATVRKNISFTCLFSNSKLFREIPCEAKLHGVVPWEQCTRDRKLPSQLLHSEVSIKLNTHQISYNNPHNYLYTDVKVKLKSKYLSRFTAPSFFSLSSFVWIRDDKTGGAGMGQNR